MEKKQVEEKKRRKKKLDRKLKDRIKPARENQGLHLKEMDLISIKINFLEILLQVPLKLQKKK